MLEVISAPYQLDDILSGKVDKPLIIKDLKIKKSAKKPCNSALPVL